MRAALESSAFQTVEVSEAMQLDSHHRMPLTTLRVDGGMTANSLLMQFLSDLLEVPLVRYVGFGGSVIIVAVVVLFVCMRSIVPRTLLPENVHHELFIGVLM